MKTISKLTLSILTLSLFSIQACREDVPELGDPPSAAEAQIVVTESSQSANIIHFSAPAANGIASWDFGNNVTAQGKSVTTQYPRKGTYTVTLNVFAKGGRVTSTKDIVIQNDDFSLLADSMYTWLTGGVDSVNGKTWVIDSANAGHFGVGPNPVSSLGPIPEYWAAPAGDKAGVGMYDDRYTFKIDGFGFEMKTNGHAYVQGDFASDFPGAYQNKGDFTVPYPNQLNESWTMQFEAGKDSTLTLSSGSWMGFWTGTSSYQIIRLSDKELFLRQLHVGNDVLAWYHRLIPEGYVPPAGGGKTEFSLPMDFETVEPVFTPFGNSTVQVIDNPDARPGSINTSQRVLETVHGDETWAGVSVDLDSYLNFTTDTLIKLKVWANNFIPGTFRLKIEDRADTSKYIEKDVRIPVAFNWVEISFGFTGARTGTYDRLVLFPGWNTTSPVEYYIDDIRQTK